MKFEKINENKLKIVFSRQDLLDKNIDIHALNKESFEIQDVFWDALHQAEEDYDFDFTESQLLVEGSASINGSFVLTITKLDEQVEDKNIPKVKIKRKVPEIKNAELLYSFNSFEDFSSFSNRLGNLPANYKNILYEYNDLYYVVFTNLFKNQSLFKKTISILSDFGDYVPYNDLFKSILAEKGKIIIPKNAIKTINETYNKKRV